MTEKKSFLSSGLGMVGRNKRYIVWFWLLNLTLAEFGTSGFRGSAHAILDHSFYADRLLHGFSLSVVFELLARPEFGSFDAVRVPALFFAFLFFLATALFLPGVFQGYASTYRLPREDFFCACGRNLWRFVRLMIVSGIVMGGVAAIGFGTWGALVKKAGDSTNELLPFRVQMACLGVIFLVMTTLRIWFDLAEADIVLDDQRAVRKSIWRAFLHTFKGLGSLLGSYVVATIVAAIILAGGVCVWIKFVPSDSVIGAFIVAQVVLFLLLIPRFWQRGVAVSYWQQRMMMPGVSALPMISRVAPTPEVQPPPSAPVPGAPPATGEA